MDFLAERLSRMGPLIWAFPGGLVLLFALYFALRPRDPAKRLDDAPPPDPNAQMSLAPTGSRLGCVWTLAGVWIFAWLILIFRN
ncbi:MAG: hypothetical protein P8Z76_08925 [Alphaproteobacteria bacterium]|jgi:hypothetical protein